ncbi:MAG: thiamine-phosphate kinase [Gammaproteobacteria bacterium]|nr:thiamine-phosphate kinase [Gammaproteobacteria bacterium]
MNEFDLISVFVDQQPPLPDSVLVGPGDDAAVLRADPDTEWVLTTDSLVEGHHFPEGLPPRLLARRALAVNLSDLAAMGADPGAYLVALTCPELDADEAREFALGLLDAAAGTGAHLVGGNLARGPRSVTITATGTVPAHQALVRSHARPGDLVYVSGRIGAAAAALARIRRDPARLDRVNPEDIAAELAPWLAPEPRIALGRALRGLASACIDISDGLLADLGHLCTASGVGARVLAERLPAEGDVLTAATAGDDYELLFTLPADRESDLAELRDAGGVRVHRIGRIAEKEEVVLLDGDGEPLSVDRPGWLHF